jgi:hypothetical protein
MTASQILRFLGMLNFYRQFLPHTVAHRSPLHDVYSDPRVKGSHPITWMTELHKAFKKCKAILSHATLLAHPGPSEPLALVTDACTFTMGALLQHQGKNTWQPLSFFFKKLSLAQ